MAETQTERKEKLQELYSMLDTIQKQMKDKDRLPIMNADLDVKKDLHIAHYIK